MNFGTPFNFRFCFHQKVCFKCTYAVYILNKQADDFNNH